MKTNKVALMVFFTLAFVLLMMVNVSSNSTDSVDFKIEQTCNNTQFFSTAFAGGGGGGEEIEPPSGVVCNCGLIWGTGCKSSNYGNTCADGATCSAGTSNC